MGHGGTCRRSAGELVIPRKALEFLELLVDSGRERKEAIVLEQVNRVDFGDWKF